MNTYQSDLLDDYRLAKHEAGHALHATLVGHRVRRVVITESGGYTDIDQPIRPTTLAAKWAESPITTAVELARILGSIRAGALCEGWREPSGRDAAALEAWREAYVAHIGTNSDWTRLYAHTFERLATWARHTAVRQAIAGLAEILVHARELNFHGWQMVCGLAQLDCVPDPCYTAMLPTPTLPAQRRAQAQAVPANGGELVSENALYRFYSVPDQGEALILRREAKSTGASVFVVGEQICQDRQGQPRFKAYEYLTINAARMELARIARR